MEHKQILTEAARILTERQTEYGTPEECFSRIANIASEMLMRRVSRYEVATILLATKMGRAGESGMKADTWIDAANYAAFAAQFSTDPDSPAQKDGAQRPLPLDVMRKPTDIEALRAAAAGRPVPVARAAASAAVAAALLDE